MDKSVHSLKRGCVGGVDSIENIDVIETASPCGLQPASPRRRRGFTIIELLGVILILAILFGLILPAVKLSARTAQKKQAAADATVLAQAVLRYRQTYGFWPGAETAAADPEDSYTLFVESGRPAWADPQTPAWTRAIPIAQNTVIRALIPAAGSLAADGANPRRIRFLDIPDARLDAEGRFLDPWGAPYAIVIHPPLEAPAGGEPEPGVGPKIAGRPVGWSEVVAFSFGPPGRTISAADNLIFSTGVPR